MNSPAPTWLPYVATAIGCLGFMVAVLSLLVSMATYRRQGPRVKPSFGAQRLYYGTKDVVATVSLTNSGLAAVGVESFWLTHGVIDRVLLSGCRLVSGSDLGHYLVSGGGRSRGENLPTSLHGASSLSWDFCVASLPLRQPFASTAAG